MVAYQIACSGGWDAVVIGIWTFATANVAVRVTGRIAHRKSGAGPGGRGAGQPFSHVRLPYWPVAADCGKLRAGRTGGCNPRNHIGQTGDESGRRACLRT